LINKSQNGIRIEEIFILKDKKIFRVTNLNLDFKAAQLLYLIALALIEEICFVLFPHLTRFGVFLFWTQAYFLEHEFN